MSGNQAPHPVGVVVPVSAPQGAPPAATAPVAPSAESDIASFLAEGHTAGDEEGLEEPIVKKDTASDDEDDDSDDEDDDSDDVSDDEESDDSDEDEDEDEDEPKPKKDKFKPDPKALATAVEKNDLPALLKAMGPAAEKMLSSKAHATLRLQAKQLAKKETEIKALDTKTSETATKLGEKYGDPIAARKAAAAGDADAFVDLIEKWGGYEWNAMVKWVANSAAGRPARLEERAKASEKEAKGVSEKQAQAIAEAKTWIETGLNKADTKLLKNCPEAVDLCMEVIRSQRTSGIDTPKKALPLVLKQLKTQHARLSKYFGNATTEGKKRAQVAATKTDRSEEESTENMSVAEMISSHVKAHGGSRRRGV